MTDQEINLTGMPDLHMTSMGAVEYLTPIQRPFYEGVCHEMRKPIRSSKRWMELQKAWLVIGGISEEDAHWGAQQLFAEWKELA